MRVLIVNTSDKTGGAAVAANRLKDALNNNGVKAKMLVCDKTTNDITVVGLPKSPKLRWNFMMERLQIFVHLHFRKEHLWEIDTASFGSDITSLREFKEADIIHLSWINQGMLSLKSIRNILASGKPVVWTMHDLWPASSICHYARNCRNFMSQCSHCKLLPGGGGKNDLSAKVWKHKRNILRNNNIWFVTCSNWLGKQAKQSGLLTGQSIKSIPNPIDTRVFCPTDKHDSRIKCGLPIDKKIILFVSQKVTDERKGMDFFVDAIKNMIEKHPERKQDTVVAILGGHSEDIKDQLPLQVYPLGYIAEESTIVNVYNSADVFVLPSQEDNLPNTIMEAMACGIPCVGFNVGGIPEMIDHKKNGYVAQLQDASDLAVGIEWVIHEADYNRLSQEAINKVGKEYSQHAVAFKYIDIYNEAMAFKNYRL